MRKSLLVPAIALLAGAAVLPYWMVSAADSTSLARKTADVTLESDADVLAGVVPTRTTMARMFQDHLIDGREATTLVGSIGAAFDLRRLRAGQPYMIDRMLDGRVRRFEYEIDGDRVLIARRASMDGAPRFITAIDRIPKQTAVVVIEGEINRQHSS